MHDPRYIQVEADVYIDTTGKPPPDWRVWIARIVLSIMFSMFSLALYTSWHSSPRWGHNPQLLRCQSNLRLIGIGLMAYAADYDASYPPLALRNAHYSTAPPYTQPYGWADAIQPYIHNPNVYRCPSTPSPVTYNPSDNGFTDYWFNADLSQMATKYVTAPAVTFMAGDGLDWQNARSSLSKLPDTWSHDTGFGAPQLRHQDGANYLFADGHVKWLSGVEVYQPTPDYTFEPIPFQSE